MVGLTLLNKHLIPKLVHAGLAEDLRAPSTGVSGTLAFLPIVFHACLFLTSISHDQLFFTFSLKFSPLCYIKMIPAVSRYTVYSKMIPDIHEILCHRLDTSWILNVRKISKHSA